MAWDNGSITSDTPGAALSDKLKTLVGSTDNWSFVENVPAGTGAGQSGDANFSVDVFKCAGTGAGGNSAGTDFYVGLFCYAGDGTYPLRFTVATFERYSPIASDTNKGMCACPIGRNNTTAVVPDATDYTYDSSGGTPTWRTFGARYGTYGMYWGGANFLVNTGFAYALKLTKDVLLVTFVNGATTSSAYFGLFDSLVQTDPMPLCCVGLSGSAINGAASNTYGGFSRLPGVTAALMSGSGIATSNNNAIWNAITRPWLDRDLLAGGNVSGASDLWLGGVNLTSRIAILQRGVPAGNTWPSGVGCIRGLLKEDVLALYLPSPNVWDTTTVGAQSDWTVICGGSCYYRGAGVSDYSTITRAV